MRTPRTGRSAVLLLHRRCGRRLGPGQRRTRTRPRSVPRRRGEHESRSVGEGGEVLSGRDRYRSDLRTRLLRARARQHAAQALCRRRSRRTRNAAISIGPQAGRQFSNAQEAQRYRSNRLTELDEMIRQVQSAPQTSADAGPAAAAAGATATDSGRDLAARVNACRSNRRFPRGCRWRSAAPISAPRSSPTPSASTRRPLPPTPKSGEAHNNLAVVYLQTGRYDEAEKAVKAAEKTGFKVNPMLKEDIAAKKKPGSS